jgi:hypothetical protein
MKIKAAAQKRKNGFAYQKGHFVANLACLEGMKRLFDLV